MTNPATPVEALQHIGFEPLTDDPEASADRCLTEATRLARQALPAAQPDTGLVEALKPCPFCGGKPEMCGPLEPDSYGNSGGYVLCCKKCGASTAVVTPIKADPYDHLSVLWNRRAAAGEK